MSGPTLADAIALAGPPRTSSTSQNGHGHAVVDVYTAAAVLKETEVAELRFLPFLGQDNVIAEGQTHLLASGVRRGKTAIMARVIVPWLRLGHRVLYFTEEPRPLWRQRFRDLTSAYGTQAPWECWTNCYAVGVGRDPLLEVIRDTEANIVIADTVRHLVQAEDENDAGIVRSAVTPWLEAVAGRTFIALAHNRKGTQKEADAAEAVAGSHVLASMFDVILQLRSVATDKEGAHDRERRLTGTSRLFEVGTLTISLDDDNRMAVTAGGRGTTTIADTDRRVLAALTTATAALTTRQVREAMPSPPSIDTVQRALNRLAERSEVLRDPPVGEDAERRTVTWCLPELDLLSVAHPVSAADAGRLLRQFAGPSLPPSSPVQGTAAAGVSLHTSPAGREVRQEDTPPLAAERPTMDTRGDDRGSDSTPAAAAADAAVPAEERRTRRYSNAYRKKISEKMKRYFETAAGRAVLARGREYQNSPEGVAASARRWDALSVEEWQGRLAQADATWAQRTAAEQATYRVEHPLLAAEWDRRRRLLEVCQWVPDDVP